MINNSRYSDKAKDFILSIEHLTTIIKQESITRALSDDEITKLVLENIKFPSGFDDALKRELTDKYIKSFTTYAKKWHNEYNRSKTIYATALATNTRQYGDISKTGVPYIQEYQDRVRTMIKVLSADPPKIMEGDAKKTYINTLRNKAEMTTRYVANLEDMQEYAKKYSLVWISSHANASPRCAPHQGKLYSLDGTSGVVDGHRYVPLAPVLKLNNGNSILNGYNCRHRMIPYKKGEFAPNEYSEAEIRREYGIDARMRSYENSIRRLKMETVLLREEGLDNSAERQRYQRLTTQYELFALKNDRAYYTWRTQVSANEREILKSSETQAPQAPDVTLASFPSEWVDTPTKAKVMSNLATYINDNKAKANPNVIKAYAGLNEIIRRDGRNVVLSFDNVKGNSTRIAGTFIEAKLRSDDLHETNLHEIAHIIDATTGSWNDWKSKEKLIDAVDNVQEPISQEVKDIFSDASKENKALFKKYSKMYKDGVLSIEEANKQLRKESHKIKSVNLQDIYDAISKGRMLDLDTVDFGHGSKYFKKQDFNPAVEIFADYMALSISAPDLVDALRRNHPQLVETLEEMVKEITDKL